MNKDSGTALRRDWDARRINEVVNDPEVKRWVSQDSSPIDLSSLVADPRNVLLARDDGGTLFVNLSPGVYELHTMFRPSAGHSAVRFVRQALVWMFTSSDAMELFTRVPTSNARALKFTESFGPILQHEGLGNGPSGLEPVRIYRMAWSDWVLKSGLGDRASEFGLAPDAWVGATVATLCSGMVDKGIVLFNRWAMVAGYPLMGLALREPPVVMFNDKLWKVSPRGVEAISCQ